jgi:hypothetical protein
MKYFAVVTTAIWSGPLTCPRRLARAVSSSRNRPSTSLGRLMEFLARRRQVNPFPHMFEQGQTDLLFQAFDLDRYRRLRQVMFLGGAGEDRVARDRFEQIELPERQMHGSRSTKINE